MVLIQLHCDAHNLLSISSGFDEHEPAGRRTPKADVDHIAEDGQACLHAQVPRQRESLSEHAEALESNTEDEGPRQLRRRQSLVSYAEPSLCQKLRQGDQHTFNSGNSISNVIILQSPPSLLHALQ